MAVEVLHVVGARPNFMKAAPVLRALEQRWVEQRLVHTGQHYDRNMSEVFFEELDLPKPDIDLGVGSGSHTFQTAEVMKRLEPVLEEHQPNLVLVYGDINSTVAAAMVAARLHIPVAHVEAGLRSFDRKMPEEINRVVTDAISDFLFTTERSAEENLTNEGIAAEKIYFVGNVMIDTLLRSREIAKKSQIISDVGLQPGQYAVLTLHRPSNVDDEEVFKDILAALAVICEHIPIVFPAHPRTQARLESFGLQPRVEAMAKLIVTKPLGYLDFVHLFSNSRFVLTDSGGLQEETTALGIPCLTLRENTERPITISDGTNLLVGSNKEKIIAESQNILAGRGKSGRIPELWDGKASQRIVKIIAEQL